MTERPILFSAPMVRAILAGTKTQTRRVVKAPGWDPSGPEYSGDGIVHLHANAPHIGLQAYFRHTDTGCFHGVRCPYGQPGDRLWVREAWTVNLTGDPKNGGPGTVPIYRAEHPNAASRWRSSIHMPRFASRITLEITSVRVERLQDISEADAIAEGIEERRVSENDSRWVNYASPNEGHAYGTCGDPRASYYTLWESINGTGSWDANPWVWVVEFKRINPTGNT